MASYQSHTRKVPARASVFALSETHLATTGQLMNKRLPDGTSIKVNCGCYTVERMALELLVKADELRPSIVRATSKELGVSQWVTAFAVQARRPEFKSPLPI